MVRGVFATLLATVAVPVMILAQAPATTGHQHEHAATQAPAPAQGENQQQMKQMHQKMMAEMAAMDQKLDSLVAQMNSAQGPAKVDAMAAIINEMLAERKQMREHMASMMGQGGMMGGMMGQGGMAGGQGQQGMMMGTSGGMMSATFDPVCRARMADNTAPTATYRGKTYQFCSEADKQAFLKNPAQYVGVSR